VQIQVFEHDWMSRSSGFKRVLFNGTHRGCLYMGRVNFPDSSTPLPENYWDLPIAEVHHVSGFAGASVTIDGVETLLNSYGDVMFPAGVS
jgi:hypothetical protein